MLELVRGEMRYEKSHPIRAARPTVDLDASLVTQQTRRQVEAVLNDLPAKDREILCMLFLQDSDKADVSRRFGFTTLSPCLVASRQSQF